MRKLIKFTKREMVDLYESIIQITEKHNKNFTYVLSIVKKKLKDDVEALLESLQPSDGYKDYDIARRKIVDQFAERNDDGSIVTHNGAIKLNRDGIEDCKLRIAELDEKYSEVLEERLTDYANFEKILDESLDVELETISWEFVPENIDQKLMDALLPIIER